MREAPHRLRCEYLDDPLGIDTDRPRLSWWTNDQRPAELQSAYQIQAASTVAGLQAGTANLWDTGCVSSQQTSNIEYRGKPLASGARVWWRVRCYDSDGIASPWSAPACFELGLLAGHDWQARWVAAPVSGSPATAVPAPVLYRDFELPRAPVAARLYLAVLGCAVGEINGAAVSRHENLEPWSDLRRRVPYRALDVTRHLHGGRNRLALILGDGDYCGHVAGGRRQRYGARPALCAQLIVELDSGERQVIASDERWRWHPSWVLRADRDGGEEVDGRQLRPGWSLPGTVMAGYPVVEENISPERFAQRAPVVVSGPGFEPEPGPERRRDADGTVRLRFDFRRSLLGRVRLELLAPAHTTVAVRYGDVALHGSDTAAHGAEAAVQWAPAEDRYTARGGQSEVFEPRFALHAFRWVEVRFDDPSVQVQAITAREVFSTAERTAEFSCDHRLLETLFRVTDRTLHMGLALGPVSALAGPHRRSVTADCEAVLAGATACRDVPGLFQGWLVGLADVQDDRGRQPASLPDGGHSPMVEEVPLLSCLWLLYRCYGDHRLLERLFPAVQRYLAGMAERAPALTAQAGRTASPGADMLAVLWYGYGLTVATRMAGVLGRLGDLERYDGLARRAAACFRERFLTRQGLLVDDHQLGYLLALELGWLESDERDVALGRLEARLRQQSFHPDVDLRHGALLLEVLSLEGRTDLAYQVLLQTTAPSWLHPLAREDAGLGVLQDEATGVGGRLAVGCIAAWLQRFLLGLELDDNLTPEVNAYRRMRIQPRPPMGEGFAAGPPVREATGHLDTIHGRYECGWRLTDDAFELKVRVPGNCAALVVLPDGSEHTVVAGTHEFSVPHGQPGAGARQPAPDSGESGEHIPVLREVSR